MARALKARPDFEAGELNLLPIMNLICLLIPFLLMTAQFVRIGVLLVETPRSSSVPGRPPAGKQALGLSLVVTDRGLYLKSRHGAECPAGVSADARLCFAREQGKLTPKVLKKLQHHLWYLQASRYKGSDHYSVPDERHAITVIPEPSVRYDDLIQVLDVIREIPRDASSPPPPADLPSGGCAFRFDRKSGSWMVPAGAGDGADQACMYYRVTLALGST